MEIISLLTTHSLTHSLTDRKKSTKQFFLTISLFIFLSTYLAAQTAPYLSVVPTPTGLSQGKQDFVNRISNDPITKEMYFISNEELTNYLDSEGNLTFTLPGFNETVSCTKVKLTNSEVVLDNVIGIVETYMANIDGETGYVLISTAEDHLAGVVQTSDHFWEILPINDNVSILREQDISLTPTFTCGSGGGTQLEAPKGESVSSTITSASCDPPDICNTVHTDVLLLNTPAVPLWYGASFTGWGAVAHFWIGLASAQMAANNSQFFSANYRFHFGGTIPFASPGNNMLNDINSIKDGIGGTLRTSYQADLVLVLSSNPGYGTALGQVNDIEETPCIDCGFAMVDVASMVGPAWVLAHEVGHLFAARHNWSANVSAGCAASGCSDDTDICGHAFRFSTDATMNRTVTSFPGTPGTPILGYSNPDVTSGGVPTGIPAGNTGTESDNVRVMRNSACTVKNYLPDPYFSAKVCCPSSFYCENDQSFQLFTEINEAAPVYLGHPPYSTQWEATAPWGNDPPPPVSISGSSTGATANFVINGVGPATITVTVTSSDGVVVSDSKSINIFSENSSSCFQGGGGENRLDNNLDEKSYSLSDFQIHPNPFTSTTKLIWPVGYEGTPSFILLDGRGQIIKNIGNLGKYNNTFNLGGVPTGVYFLQIQDEFGSTVKKIIKQNL